MTDVVAQMLRESDNSTAELLIKELGHGAGDPSTAGGLAVATAALAEAGIDMSGVTMADGSGLSVDNRVPCDVLVDVLSGSEPAPTIQAGLAVAAETGTLAERFRGSDAAGVLRAKTGTLNSTTALAGVLEIGRAPLVFGLIANVSSDARRVGKECVSTGRSRWSPVK